MRRSPRLTVGRYLVVAWFGVWLGGSPAFAVDQPAPSPDDVAKAINDLGDKIKGLQGGNAAVAAAVKKLDAVLQPLRDAKDPDYIKRITGDLTSWLTGLKDDDAKKAAWAQIAPLWAAANGVRDKSLADAITSVVSTLTADLDKPLSDGDKTAIVDKLGPLGVKLDALVKDRGRKVHIISARYGDIGHRSNGKWCDATAYFVGACEGKTSCPNSVVANAAPDPLDGAHLCGYEPAPLAGDGVSYAEVKYKCIYFGMRDLDTIKRQEQTNGPPIVLHPKDRIVCNIN